MYYSRANRGLSFTKPGIYAFCLVLLVGLVAVSSGINGLYVFLSAGLGGFIVSGMLSELAIRSCTVKAVTGALVDAEAPFRLTFLVENSSTWFSVFAMRNLFLLEPPRFRLIAHVPKAIGAVTVARIAPATNDLHSVTISGMPRGTYDQLMTLQTTRFPFGILEKFKLLDLHTELLVAPRLDPAEVEDLQRLLAKDLRRLIAEQDFYCHRPYTGRESRRAVDWKKSANRATADWVVRDLRTPAGGASIWLDLPWSVLRQLGTELSYERLLVRTRAALEVLNNAGVGYGLDFGEGMAVVGGAACLMALARLPAYELRHQGLPKLAPVQAPRQSVRVRLAG